MYIFFSKIKIYFYLLKLSLKKQTRTAEQIDFEYNSGIWNRNYDEIDFESGIGNYGRKDGEEYNIYSIDGKFKKILGEEFEKLQNEEFITYFQDFKNDQIIELGCGLGINIFNLHKSGFKNLSACDISSNAIEKLIRYNNLKNLKINFFVHDLKNPFLKNELNNKVVFTFTALEQCKHIMSIALENILNSKPKIILNFEVNYDSSPYLVKKYFDVRDYQNNLVSELKLMEKEKKIKIIDIKKLFYSGTTVNSISVIVWKPA